MCRHHSLLGMRAHADKHVKACTRTHTHTQTHMQTHKASTTGARRHRQRHSATLAQKHAALALTCTPSILMGSSMRMSAVLNTLMMPLPRHAKYASSWPPLHLNTGHFSAPPSP